MVAPHLLLGGPYEIPSLALRQSTVDPTDTDTLQEGIALGLVVAIIIASWQ
jgi:hypothetical protein